MSSDHDQGKEFEADYNLYLWLLQLEQENRTAEYAWAGMPFGRTELGCDLWHAFGGRSRRN